MTCDVVPEFMRCLWPVSEASAHCSAQLSARAAGDNTFLTLKTAPSLSCDLESREKLEELSNFDLASGATDHPIALTALRK